MRSVASLRNEVDRLRQKINELDPPCSWVFVIVEGEDLSDEQRAQIKPNDRIIVQFIPRAYLG